MAEKQNRKMYYSMGEVAEMFDVNESLIRYWESKFDILRPKRNKKGNRMFRPEDVENLKMIYHLVKECGMTLEGAKRAMRSRGREDVSRSAELMERLQSLRSMLVEIRDMLRDGDADGMTVSVTDDDSAADYAPAVADVAVVADEADEADAAASAEVEAAASEAAPAVTVIEPHEKRQPSSEHKSRAELPFYEQTLF